MGGWGLLIFYVTSVACYNVIQVHFVKCLPCSSTPRLPPNTASPKKEYAKSYAHRNYWAYLTNKRQKNVVPLQRNFKTPTIP